MNSLWRSDGSIENVICYRLLTLASIDLLLTLPSGIVGIVLEVTAHLTGDSSPFYQGWDTLHSDWRPRSIPYAVLKTSGTALLAQSYFVRWTSPILAFAIFGLFGLTAETRAVYASAYGNAKCWIGRKSSRTSPNAQPSLGETLFVQPYAMAGVDTKVGYV